MIHNIINRSISSGCCETTWKELADTLKKQSMSEVLLEDSSGYHINLEDKTQDLKKKLGQITSQEHIKLNTSTVDVYLLK